MRNIAVVGAGIFGCEIALALDSVGFDVELFEEADSIMSKASWVNQYRLHRGYHYPRSASTIKQTHSSTKQFEAKYQEAVMKNSQNLYGVSNNETLTSPDEYLSILDQYGLNYKKHHDLRMENLDLLVEVDENLYNPYLLRNMFIRSLKDSNVNLRLQSRFEASLIKNFDQVVLCTYANNGDFINQINPLKKTINRYQLVEKIIIENEKIKDLSLVILDGPFCSIDPLGTTGTTVVGHVRSAVHGVEESYSNPWSTGIPRLSSKKDEILREVSGFVPDIVNSNYLESMWAVRCVPGQNKNDDRPTYCKKVDEKTILVFSGKISTCVMVANEVVDMLLQPYVNAASA
jgi:hypothetical protein